MCPSVCPPPPPPLQGPIFSEWFKGGKTNIAYNCLDRHVKEGHGKQNCFLFEGNDPGRDGKVTYEQVRALLPCGVRTRGAPHCGAPSPGCPCPCPPC